MTMTALPGTAVCRNCWLWNGSTGTQEVQNIYLWILQICQIFGFLYIFAGEKAQLLHTWKFKIFSTQSGCWFQVTSQGAVVVQNSSLVGWFHRHVGALSKMELDYLEILGNNLEKLKVCDISILYAFKLMLFNLKSTWFPGCLTAFFLGRNFGGGGELVVIPATLWLCRNTKKNNPFSKNIARCAVHWELWLPEIMLQQEQGELTGGVKVCQTGVNRNPWILKD